MGEIIVCNNLIKWTMIAPEHFERKLVSTSFTIQNRTCKFTYDSGNGCPYPTFHFRRPVPPPPHARYSVEFDTEEEGYKPPLSVTILVSSSQHIFNPERCYITGENNQIIWSTRSSYDLLKTTMTLQMVIHAFKEDKSVQTGSYLNGEVSVETSYEDFTKMLDVGPDHDAEIKCGVHTIKVHRIILSTRSEIFSKMLQSDMEEDRSGIIEIEDMDISCVRDFVRYLYTGAMPQLTFEKAEILYEAGDKYAVRSLMIRCSEYLQDNLSPENVVRCFALADAHSDQNLKDCVLTYMLEEKVYLQDEIWLPFCDRYPKIANEVYRLSYKNHDLVKKI